MMPRERARSDNACPEDFAGGSSKRLGKRLPAVERGRGNEALSHHWQRRPTPLNGRFFRRLPAGNSIGFHGKTAAASFIPKARNPEKKGFIELILERPRRFGKTIGMLSVTPPRLGKPKRRYEQHDI